MITNILSGLKRLLQSGFLTIGEVNRKYAKPRVKMTPMVRIALLLLRIYLLMLVIILIYKFITVIIG